ncbi:cell surface glycoprotein 1 [Thalassophryne amazonica]|uniref:cell surface glycoprotein 1 n=1 Tax=Thalassophryne amazonica TaxID=390379 RepID=UPI001471557A|nr:cell surface glycoprotein 1 [Thalassophryne amazonica]
MGGKLSKRRKGYDVSDPKDKKDEVQATTAISEEPIQASAESSTPPTVGETDNVISATAVESDTAAVTEAGAPEQPKPASPEEPAPVGPDKTAPSASEEPASGGAKEAASVPQEIQESSQGTVPKPGEAPPEEVASKAVSEKPVLAPESNIEKTAPKDTVQEEPVVAAAVEQICSLPVAPTEAPATPESEEPVPSEVEPEPVVAPESLSVVETVTVLEPQPEQEPGLSPAVPQDVPVVVGEIADTGTKVQEPEPIPQTVSGTETTVMVTETVVPLAVTETKPVTELAVELVQVQDSEKEQAQEEDLSQEPDQALHEVEPEQPPEPEQSSEPEPKQSPNMEPEKGPQQEPEQPPDAESEQPSEPETVKAKDAFEITETDSVVAESHFTELETVKPEAVAPEIPEDLPEIPEKVSTDIQPAEEETDSSSVKAAEQEATMTAHEIITLASVSPSDIPAVPKWESKMENGELQSPSLTENVEEANVQPAVNGECVSPVCATPQTEECVNGAKTPEEDPVSEQCHFELKKDMNLQEVPESVSEMVEGLSTAVTPAV